MFKIDPDGFVLADDGTRLKIGDDEIQVEIPPPPDESSIVKGLKAELQRHKEKSKAGISDREALADLEAQLRDAQREAEENSRLRGEAERRVRELQKVEREYERLKSEHAETVKARETLAATLSERDLTDAILGVCVDDKGKPRFRNPKRDVVPELRNRLKRDAPPGELLFEIDVEKNGVRTREAVSLADAIEWFEKDPANEHYLLGNPGGIPGGAPRGSAPGSPGTLQAQIAEAESKGDFLASMRLKSQMLDQMHGVAPASAAR